MALALSVAEQSVNQRLAAITNLQRQAASLFKAIQNELENGLVGRGVQDGKQIPVAIATADEVKAAWQASGKLADLQTTQAALAPLLGLSASVQ